ncbi:MAG TPA: PEP-CTERM sorting domain-containing protein [Bryobacteraceae bacterium]|nr:PEP-CTERM sorting domain-containing protein [Bryobacteraceae bacterium]
MKSHILILTVAAFAITAPAWGGSTVSSYSGDVGFINTPPDSLVPGADENDLKALLFMEDTNLVFASAITVDATAPGLYQSKASLTPGSIAAGTLISDTYLHADPVTSGTTFTGSVTFSSDILGVIATSSDLVATDPLLGVSGTTYGSIHDAPGLELSPSQDYFSISPDLRTLTFSVKTWNFTDDLRVITAGSLTATAGAQSAVPEPGTIPLIALGLGLIAIGVRRHRSTR